MGREELLAHEFGIALRFKFLPSTRNFEWFNVGWRGHGGFDGPNGQAKTGEG